MSDSPAYTVTVTSQTGTEISRATLTSLDAALLHALENALPWNTRLDAATRMLGQLRQGEPVTVDHRTITVTPED